MKERLRQAVGAAVDAAQEGLELLGLGRLSMERRTPFELVHQARDFRLRRYAAQPGRPTVECPILLLPALPLSADTYDLDTDLSVVGFLSRQGVDTWLVDFGRPEHDEQGMSRTYEQYVHAAEQALDRVHAISGRSVHLLGHSQGGVLAYQVAALRRGESVASVITLGTPVDFHSSLRFDPDLSARLLPMLRGAALDALRKLDALPAHVSQRLLSLSRLDARLFSGRANAEDRGREWPGHGFGAHSFVAIPGPTLSSLTDELLLTNRLARGGFVLGGRVASLSDITSPVLYFVGERDDLAPRKSVRAIRSAATSARETYEVSVPTGHLGLALSRRAFELTWPTVVAWMRYREGRGPVPAQIAALTEGTAERPPQYGIESSLTLVRDASVGVAASARRGVVSVARESLRAVERFRYQVSRLATLERITDTSRVSFGAMLDERAEKTPDASWFIYEGRGQTFAEANRRVDHVVRGLLACGVRRGHVVGVLMHARPSYLSLVTALSRLGAVSVLLSPDSQRASLAEARCRLSLDALVADPDNIQAARAEFPGKLLMLGAPRSPRPDVPNVLDMELIDTHALELPAGFQRNPGRANELAMIVFTAAEHGSSRLGYVTHRRFVEIAYTAAALGALSPRDTVYAVTPLHHASGIALSVGGALAGGARVALAPAFVAERFWPEVRRYGVTVVFYAGDMLRELLFLPSTRGEHDSPIRLLAGSGMCADTTRRLRERFGVPRLLEFYAVIDGSSLLVNVNPSKPSALGKPLGGAQRAPFLAAYSFERGEVLRDERGMCIEAADDEPGVLLYAIEQTPSSRPFGGQDTRRIEEHVRRTGDAFGFSGDVMRRDPQGEFWLLDRVDDVLNTPHGIVFSQPVESVFLSLPDVCAAVLLGEPALEPEGVLPPSSGQWASATLCVLVVRRGRALDAGAVSGVCRQRLSPDERPLRICVVDEIPLSDGGRPRRREIAAALRTGSVRCELVYDPARAEYLPAGEAHVAE